MIIEESVLKVGGRPLRWRIGKILNEWGLRIMQRNKHITVTNPTCKIVNPFTMIVSFTADTTDKYQVVIQGDYKKIYKEAEENTPDLTLKEMFIIIGENRNLWFKKE